MKLFRRLSALIMALVLMLSLSIGVLAADFDNMADGFAYDGEDAEVNINLKEDDEYGSYEAKEGKTYNISSDNDSVLFSSEFKGSGTVNIDTAVEGYLIANDQADVTVNGDADAFMHTYNQGSLTVNGNVDGGVYAYGQSELTVNGDVNGRDGNPDSVDYSDPSSFSDGIAGVHAREESTVTVTGNVTGGDGYGTYGWGGTGVDAYEQATVTVGGDVAGGNVTADPNTEAGYYANHGGKGIYAEYGASVTVGGNVTGGSTNGDQGNGGAGIVTSSYGQKVTVTVEGAVSAGKAENGTDGVGITVGAYEGNELPSITVGAYDTATGIFFNPETYEERYMTEEELDSIITVTGISEPGEIVSPSESISIGWDSHYGYLLQLIRAAKEGDEITTNIGARKSMPSAIIDAARDKNITLIIQWTGGEDLVITRDFTEELHGYVLITDLADMLKK